MPGFGSKGNVASFSSTTFKPKKVRASACLPCCTAYLLAAACEKAFTAVPHEQPERLVSLTMWQTLGPWANAQGAAQAASLFQITRQWVTARAGAGQPADHSHSAA